MNQVSRFRVQRHKLNWENQSKPRIDQNKLVLCVQLNLFTLSLSVEPIRLASSATQCQALFHNQSSTRMFIPITWNQLDGSYLTIIIQGYITSNIPNQLSLYSF